MAYAQKLLFQKPEITDVPGDGNEVQLFVRKPPPRHVDIPLVPLLSDAMRQALIEAAHQLEDDLVEPLRQALANPTAPDDPMGEEARRHWFVDVFPRFQRTLLGMEAALMSAVKHHRFVLVTEDRLQMIMDTARARPAWDEEAVRHGMVFADMQRLAVPTADAPVILDRLALSRDMVLQPVVFTIWGAGGGTEDSFYVTAAQHEQLLAEIQTHVDLLQRVIEEYDQETMEGMTRLHGLENQSIRHVRIARSRQLPGFTVTLLRRDLHQNQQQLEAELGRRLPFSEYFAFKARRPDPGTLELYWRWFTFLARLVDLGGEKLRPMVMGAQTARQRLDAVLRGHDLLAARIHALGTELAIDAAIPAFPFDQVRRDIAQAKAARQEWQNAVSALGPARVESVQQTEARLAPLLSDLTSREQAWTRHWVQQRSYSVASSQEQDAAQRALLKLDRHMRAAERPLLDLRAALAEVRRQFAPEVIASRDTETIAKWSAAPRFLRPWYIACFCVFFSHVDISDRYEDEGEPGIRPAWIDSNQGLPGSEKTQAMWQHLVYDPVTHESTMQPRLPTPADEYLRATLYSPMYRQELDTIAAERVATLAEEKARREHDRARYMDFRREQVAGV